MKNSAFIVSNEPFLKKYVNTPSPSGYELELGGQQVWIDFALKYAHRVETDAYGNAYAYYGSRITDKNGKVTRHKKDKTVLIDAHADEIGFIVSDITDEGFIRIETLGGADITIAPSSRVNLWVDKDTKIKGVFGHPAIHVHRREFEAKKEEMFIDIGLSTKDEVLETGIVVGTPITMQDGYMDMGNYYCGRSLDDKIGGFITMNLLRLLSEKKIELPYELVIVNSVQEEVGLFGAKMAADRIKPDVAIAIDVTHCTDSPAYNKQKQGSLSAGKGVVVMSGPSLHNKVVKKLISTCEEYDIPFQRTATGGHSGTNADSYAYSNGGIPTGLIKMAMRYMHTTVETVHKEDVKSAIKLLGDYLINNNPTEDLEY